MPRLKITARNQITLKQELLKHLGVHTGEEIEADKLPDGRILLSAATQDGTISDFIGCLSQRSGPTLRIEQINKIATQGWAKSK